MVAPGPAAAKELEMSMPGFSGNRVCGLNGEPVGSRAPLRICIAPLRNPALWRAEETARVQTAMMLVVRHDRLFLLLFLLGTVLLSPANVSADPKEPEENADAPEPANFSFETAPLYPAAHPHWDRPVNAKRLYDFYAKEAEHFMRLPEADRPALLPPYPGIEGGESGHWGAKGDREWTDDRWNAMDLGPAMGGVFRGGSGQAVKGVAVRLNDALSVCFDPMTLGFREIWRGGFVKFDSARWGFLGGIKPAGKTQFTGDMSLTLTPESRKRDYLGYHRHGHRLIFSYRLGEITVLDSPSAPEHGNGFHRHLAFSGPASGKLPVFHGLSADEVHLASDDGVCQVITDSSGKTLIEFRQVTALRIALATENDAPAPLDLAALCQGGPFLWPETLETRGVLGSGDGAYGIDTLTLPHENPWNALFFCSGHDFFSDGSAAVATIQGDVWLVRGIDETLEHLAWKRFAAGLHQPLGLVIVDDVIHVLGKDQITRLHDHNGDDEADTYECFLNDYTTSPGGHDFITGLERDGQGNFWFASTHLGIVRVAADGSSWETVATGLRNPNGLGVSAGGLVTSAPQEGEWTPTSMICEIQPGRHFGYGGPKNGRVDQPLCYLPRGVDHASGGQVFVESDRWGPLRDQLLHFSWGNASHILVLRDVVDSKEQGAAIPLPGDFLSGAHRGRFHPGDGQLYVTGASGWSTYAPEDGSFQRVRYTGKPVHLPVEWRAHYNGMVLRFTEPLDSAVAGDPRHYFAQQWNYRYSKAYGSDEYSVLHPGTPGHDLVKIRSAHVLDSGHAVFLEIPEIMPVHQMHLRMKLSAADGTHFNRDLFATIHNLRPPFTDFPDYQPVKKTQKVRSVATAERKPILLPKHPGKPIGPGAREIVIKCIPGLKYDTTAFEVEAGESIALKLLNDDVIPHNLAIVTPGNRDRIGERAAKMLSDPDALDRHYVPEDDAVLWHTLVIDPGTSDTIHFVAPEIPGTYPYLCTFPGHWQIMLGDMHVVAK